MSLYSVIILMIFLIPSLMFILSFNYQKNLLFCHPYECGVDFFSSSRLPFSFSFYLIALTFVFFDIELVLLLPLMLHFFFMVLPIIFILLLGLYLEWMNGILQWFY